MYYDKLKITTSKEEIEEIFEYLENKNIYVIKNINKTVFIYEILELYYQLPSQSVSNTKYPYLSRWVKRATRAKNFLNKVSLYFSDLVLSRNDYKSWFYLELFVNKRLNTLKKYELNDYYRTFYFFPTIEQCNWIINSVSKKLDSDYTLSYQYYMLRKQCEIIKRTLIKEGYQE